MKHPLFKKADIILFVVLLAIAAAGLLAFRAPGSDAEDSSLTAVVLVDGEETDRLRLSDDQSVIVETVYGTNVVTIKAGVVSITDADCRGQDCVRMGGISKAGQMIVCLPHHLTVVIEGDGSAPDAVIK